MKNSYIAFAIFGASVLITSCSKPKGFPQQDVLPATYNFENVNYSGQTTRVSMLDEMVVYMKTGNTSGTVLDATILKNMFANSGSPFSDTALNTSGKQLKNKCFALDVAKFESYMDSLALASTSIVPGSNGVAGVVVSTTNPSKKYLFDANGKEFGQIIEKGLMAAVFYYQACETYLSDSGIGAGVDNVTVVPGEGTAMQHHWDEAFGYFTAPIDFPANTTGIKYWSKYSNTVDPAIGSNSIMMNEFKRGRLAINNNDHTTKTESAILIKATWDKVIAAVAIHYINETLANFSDDALRNHSLSEATAFINGLKYNSTRVITLSEIDTLLGYIGNNFYTVSSTNITLVKNTLSSIYGLDDVKDVL